MKEDKNPSNTQFDESSLDQANLEQVIDQMEDIISDHMNHDSIIDSSDNQQDKDDEVEDNFDRALEGVKLEDEIYTEEDYEKVYESEADEDLFALDAFSEEEHEDLLWQARTGLNYDSLCGAVETIIFMSERPITLQKIKGYIDQELPLRVLHQSISRLQEEYEQKHHGLRLQEVADGYQFRTKATYSKFVQEICKVTSLVLSPTALEVLAIIAYKQPISKNEIEKIRGVDSSHIVRGLMDKRLVKVAGRSDDLGKPVVYGTTTEFLEVFNLKTLDDLPPEYELEDMATKNEVGAIGDIKEIVGGDKSKFHFNDMEELDQLRETIRSIISETDFTKSLNVENKKRPEADTVRRSAFEILEEHVNKEEVTNINLQAVDSNILTSVSDARVVDLTKVEGLLNAPEPLDEEDDEVSIEDAFENQNNEVEGSLLEGLSSSAADWKERDEDFSQEMDDEINSKMDAIDNTTEKMLSEAKDLDIELQLEEGITENITEEDIEDPNHDYAFDPYSDLSDS